MTNEELLERIGQGEESALLKLCEANAGLIRSRAREIAARYDCLRLDAWGYQTAWTRETLSELESVGTVELIERVRSGGYDNGRGAFTTYIVPFLDGAMRRHLEASMGTLSLDRKSMARVRHAQMLYYGDGKTISEIADALGISLPAAARAAAYPTHFLSVYDLAGPAGDGDAYDRLPLRRLSASAEENAFHAITIEGLRTAFCSLPKQEQDILGRSFGVFGYPASELREIAMRNLLREDGVEKAKKRALKHLRELCLDSFAWKLRRAKTMVDRAKR